VRADGAANSKVYMPGKSSRTGAKALVLLRRNGPTEVVP
jgi:hypothetical protein